MKAKELAALLMRDPDAEVLAPTGEGQELAPIEPIHVVTQQVCVATTAIGTSYWLPDPQEDKRKKKRASFIIDA